MTDKPIPAPRPAPSTPRRTPPRGMVPPHLDPDGAVAGPAAWRDVRVPVPFSARGPAHALSSSSAARCPDGRHQWDVIVVTDLLATVHEPSLSALLDTGTAPADAGRGSGPQPAASGAAAGWQRFRMRLTCLRCGRVEGFEGLHRELPRPLGNVDPMPLRVGALLAQRIVAGDCQGPLATWVVHEAAEHTPVGTIVWCTTGRGKAAYRGSFDDDPDGETVVAGTPLAALRRLADLDRTASPDRTATVDPGQSPADPASGDEGEIR